MPRPTCAMDDGKWAGQNPENVFKDLTPAADNLCRKSNFRAGNTILASQQKLYLRVENLGKWVGQNPDFLFT